MRIWNREIAVLMLNFTWIESNCKTIYYHLGAKKIAKSVQALYLVSTNLHFMCIFSANNSLLLVQLGIFASNVFVFCFFTKNTFVIFWKGGKKLFLARSCLTWGGVANTLFMTTIAILWTGLFFTTTPWTDFVVLASLALPKNRLPLPKARS